MTQVRLASLIAIVAAACSASHELDIEVDELARAGGWDYNNARWNSAVDFLQLGPAAPYGALGPNTLDPYSHIVFHPRPFDPVPCVSRDAAVTGVYVVGSGSDAGGPRGPIVMVQRGNTAAPLGFDESITMAASVRSQVMAPAAAIPVVLRMRRVHDFVRPGGWIKWPMYATEMIHASCDVTRLAVGIFGPAPVLPTSASATTGLATMPDVMAFYAGYYDRVDPSLLAKSAMNLDAPLTFPWETATSGRSCTSGTAIPANHVAFLGAFATGAAMVTHDPDDAQQRPILMFGTRPGQPYKAHMSAMIAATAEAVCLRDDQRPPGTTGPVPNAKLAWPSANITELDVVHVAGMIELAGEAAASNFTWVTSGISARRLTGFRQASQNEERLELADQALDARGDVVIKNVAGALPSWSAFNPLLADRTSLAVVAETLADTQQASGVEWNSLVAMMAPTCMDRICGIGEIVSCPFDCPEPIEPPPPTDAAAPDGGSADGGAGGADDAAAADAGAYDAGAADAGAADAGATDAGWASDASPADASPADAGSPSDGGAGMDAY